MVRVSTRGREKIWGDRYFHNDVSSNARVQKKKKEKKKYRSNLFFLVQIHKVQDELVKYLLLKDMSFECLNDYLNKAMGSIGNKKPVNWFAL